MRNKIMAVTEIGLGQGEVVKLTLADDVSPEIRQQLDKLAAKLISGEIRINTSYEGPEFNPAIGEFVPQSFKEGLKAKS